MPTRRVGLAMLVALSAALLSGKALAQAEAQNWPQKPVTVIVPFAAGGNTDGIARMVAQKLSEGLNQQFVVENKGGAGGALAADFVARAQPDGYTLFLTAHSVLTVVPKMMKVKYDPAKDFATISNVATNPFVLVVHKDMPVNNVAEFVKYVKEKNNNVSYASAGQGSLAHLSMALFLNEAGIEMVHVPYKGNAPALSDVLAGHVPAMFSNLSDVIPHATSGNLKLLAVSGEKRAPQLPNVPTVAESGYPNYQFSLWNGIVVPAGTPDDIITKIRDDVLAASKTPEMQKSLVDMGATVVGSTPADFGAFMRSEVDTLAELVNKLGMKPE